MKKIFLLILTLAFINIKAQKINILLDDKTAHIYAGAFISSSTQLITYSIMKNKNIMLSGYIGNSVAFMAGVGKEIYDTQKLNPTGYSYEDMLATAYGACVGNIILSVTLDAIDTHKRLKQAKMDEKYNNLNEK